MLIVAVVIAQMKGASLSSNCIYCSSRAIVAAVAVAVTVVFIVISLTCGKSTHILYFSRSTDTLPNFFIQVKVIKYSF